MGLETTKGSSGAEDLVSTQVRHWMRASFEKEDFDSVLAKEGISNNQRHKTNKQTSQVVRVKAMGGTGATGWRTTDVNSQQGSCCDSTQVWGWG